MDDVMVTIFANGDKLQARALMPGSLHPIEVFFRTDDFFEMFAHLDEQFHSFDAVEPHRWQMELDHIKLFGCRWDAESIVMPAAERLSDEEIGSILNDVATSLDTLEDQLNALHASPLVEDEPKFPI